MKLKIIRPNTVIHCKTREESECLLDELHKSGIKWRSGESLKEYKFDADSPLGTGYWLSKDMRLEWAEISYFTNRTVEYGEIIPFSSLVIEEKTYEDGLNDAWECAKKISLESFSYQGALTDEELKEAFGTFDLEKIMTNNVVDVIGKLEAYEANNQIKVGDVVMSASGGFLGLQL